MNYICAFIFVALIFLYVLPTAFPELATLIGGLAAIILIAAFIKGVIKE